MTTTAEHILEQALRLPPVDRAELIGRLFQSFDDDGVDSAWADEIESRIDAYDAGQLTASPAEDVLERINRR